MKTYQVTCKVFFKKEGIEYQFTTEEGGDIQLFETWQKAEYWVKKEIEYDEEDGYKLVTNQIYNDRYMARLENEDGFARTYSIMEKDIF